MTRHTSVFVTGLTTVILLAFLTAPAEGQNPEVLGYVPTEQTQRVHETTILTPPARVQMGGTDADRIHMEHRSPILLTGKQIKGRDTTSIKQHRMLLEVLETSFASLAESNRRARWAGGFVLAGLGAASGLGGAATLAFGEGRDARIVGYSLLGGGVLFGGLSLLPFNLRGETERIYEDFSEMSADTPEQVRRKYAYWDNRFEEMAEEKRTDRIIGGATSITAGIVAGFVGLGGTGEEDLEELVWSAVGPILGGVTTLMVKSKVEQRYETYRRAKQDILRDDRTASQTEARFGIAPVLTGGIAAVLQVRF